MESYLLFNMNWLQIYNLPLNAQQTQELINFMQKQRFAKIIKSLNMDFAVECKSSPVTMYSCLPMSGSDQSRIHVQTFSNLP